MPTSQLVQLSKFLTALLLCFLMSPMPVQWCITLTLSRKASWMDGKFYPGGSTTGSSTSGTTRQHDAQGGGGRRMAIFDLLLNCKYIDLVPEVAPWRRRYEE